MDLFGPTTYKSHGGNLYCLVIVDDYSRYTWTFFLEDKSVRPGAAGLLTGVEYSRVGSTAWVCPTSTVTTRTVVELA